VTTGNQDGTERTSSSEDAVTSNSGVRWLPHAVVAALILIIGFSLAWLTLTSRETAGRRDAPPTPARLVKVSEVVPGPQTVSITAWGTVVAARTLTLTPQVSGEVESISDGLDAGQTVSKGQVLVKLDRRDQALAVAQQKAAVAQAQAELDTEQGQQAIARQEYQLLGESLSSDQQQRILRAPQLASARANLAAAEANLEQAQLSMSRTQVVAPFDALVLSREVAPGARVSTTSALATLVGTDRWRVELAVPVRALPWLAFGENADSEDGGSSVRLWFDAVWPEGTYREGQLLRLLGDLENEGQLARVLVEVDDPLALTMDKPRLLLGSFLRAEIRGRTLDEAVKLEPGWLRGDSSVWVMDADSKLQVKSVTIAYRDADRVLVTEGLNAGDRVVTSSMSVATPGMRLRTEAAIGANAAATEGDG